MEKPTDDKKGDGSSVYSSGLLAKVDHWKQRAFEAEKLALEAHHCFSAAIFEGIFDAIEGTGSEKLMDIWLRRLTNIAGALERFHDSYEEAANGQGEAQSCYAPEIPFKHDTGMVYSLRQNGWRKGEPQMENDVWINIQSRTITREQRDAIASVIVDALNAAFPSDNA